MGWHFLFRQCLLGIYQARYWAEAPSCCNLEHPRQNCALWKYIVPLAKLFLTYTEPTGKLWINIVHAVR